MGIQEQTKVFERLNNADNSRGKYLYYLNRLDDSIKENKEDYMNSHSAIGRYIRKVGVEHGVSNDYSKFLKQNTKLNSAKATAQKRLEAHSELTGKLVDSIHNSVVSSDDPIIKYLLRTASESKDEGGDKRAAVGSCLYGANTFYDGLNGLSQEDRQYVLERVPDFKEGLSPREIVCEKRKLDFENLKLEQLIGVHATNYLPRGKIGCNGDSERIRVEGKDGIMFAGKSPRQTVHFSLNSMVNDHRDGGNEANVWSNKKFAILQPMELLKNRLAAIYPTDSYTLGAVPMSAASEIIVASRFAHLLSPSVCDIIKRGSGAGIVSIGKEGESLPNSVIRRIGERGYSYKPQGPHHWEDARGDDHLADEKLGALAKSLGIKCGTHINLPSGALETIWDGRLKTILFNYGPTGGFKFSPYEGIGPVDLLQTLRKEELNRLVKSFDGREMTPESRVAIGRIEGVFGDLEKRYADYVAKWDRENAD
jgi:hypothetical protein